ncbi:MAG: hypothetical protein FWD31_08580 [Planctomycetaceae bacterium]|nr:hypothetical protein [Planctomycetaceae bacterium]
MPTERLDKVNETEIFKYSACATEIEVEGKNFIDHVGLSSEDQSATYAAMINWTHMAPPFRSGKDYCVHLAASFDLSEDEILQIGHFIETYDEETKPFPRERMQYVIYPAKKEPTKNNPCRRFSCAGFVIEAYRFAGIILLDNLDLLPKRDLEFIKLYYREVDCLGPKLLSRLGLDELGSWPVLLPGYVFHAFADEIARRNGIPFQPEEKHAFFLP